MSCRGLLRSQTRKNHQDSSLEGGERITRWRPSTPPSGTLPTYHLTPNPVKLSSNSKELQKSLDGLPSFAQCMALTLPLQHHQQRVGLQVRWCDPSQPIGGQRTHPPPLPPICQGTQRVPLSHLKTPQTHDPPWLWQGAPCHGKFSQINWSSHKQWQTLLPFHLTVYPIRGGHYRHYRRRATWLNSDIPFTT